MNTSAYYRVPAVIFAVLVGSLFVYAKSGARFFTSARPVPSPAGENDPSVPRIEFLMGSKSAPAFRPEESAPPLVQAESATQSTTRLLPGSKSAQVILPESLVSPTPVNTANQAATQGQSAPNATSGPRLLPGSKSLILVDPSTLQPPAQPAARTLLPGSKSDTVIDPKKLVPPAHSAQGAPR